MEPAEPVRMAHLDMLRGVAAFLVLAAHLRGYLLPGFNELTQSGILIQVFYFATGLGHQSVVVFFVLSGYLVGGSVIENLLRQHFIWPRYLLRRLTRLWIVIVPALLLTLLFDSLGQYVTGGVGYDGQYWGLYNSGAHLGTGIDQSSAAFIGNLLFLQTIHVPVFGSNGPIWSLTNEFWYYLVFPLAGWLLLGRATIAQRLLGFVVLLSVVLWLPFELLWAGMTWLAGAAAAWCTRRKWLADRFRQPVTAGVLVGLMLAAIIATKRSPAFFGDLALGLVVALSLPALALLPSPGDAYDRYARATSEISYTLYLTHFPFVTVLVLSTLAPVRFPPGPKVVGLYLCLLFAAIGWAVVVWWCFERNTDRVFSALTAFLPERSGVRSRSVQISDKSE